jgi:hypothetical protein
MSDEGRLENRRRAIHAALEEAGFELDTALRTERSAVTVPFGLISNGVAYVMPGREEDAARAIAAVRGVDLVVTRERGGKRCRVWKGESVAELAMCRGAQGVEYAYLPVRGDPLGYVPVVERLRRRAGDERREFFPDDWWFDATWSAAYPDALYRVLHSFELVQNPASLVFSMERGFMCGAKKTTLGAWFAVGHLRGTHGALRSLPSQAFLMSDYPGWSPPAAVRYDQALAPFARPPAVSPAAADR